MVRCCLPSVYPCIHPSNRIPISEVQIPSNMSAALNPCFLCNVESPSLNTSSTIRRKTCYTPNIATLKHDSSTFVRIELLCISICRIPPNRAYVVTVFEDSPIWYNIALRYNEEFFLGAELYYVRRKCQMICSFILLEFRRVISCRCPSNNCLCTLHRSLNLERFFGNFGKTFTLSRQCAEFIFQQCRIKVKVRFP